MAEAYPMDSIKANKLDAALLAAQGDAPVLPQDARNSHAGYSYCSAKKIIAIGGALLRRHGLVLVPLVSEPKSDGKELHTAFVLRHAASGQSQTYTRTVAVHAHRGKELDKATAAADTSAFAYMLRRVLALPDVECELNDPAPCAVDEVRRAPAPVRQTPPVPVRVAPRPPMAAPRMTPAGAAIAKQLAECTVERTAKDKPAHKQPEAHAGNNALLHERLRNLSIEFRDQGEQRGLKSRARAALLETWAGCNLTGPHRSDPSSKMLLPDLVTGAVLERIERGFSSWQTARAEEERLAAATA